MRTLALMLFFTLSHFGFASEFIPYKKDSFESAQAAGKKILLQFHATWCPTCRTQSRVLNPLLKSKDFEKIQSFAADYDTEKELKKIHKVQHQSTLLLFQGTHLIERSEFMTGETQLKEFLETKRN